MEKSCVVAYIFFVNDVIWYIREQKFKFKKDILVRLLI